MDYKNEKAETEIINYKRIFNDNYKIENDGPAETNKLNQKKEREKRFITVFFAQLAVCFTIICSMIILKHAKPDTFDSVSSVLNGFYENNITLSDLNKLIDEKIMGNDAVATFFNFNHER